MLTVVSGIVSQSTFLDFVYEHLPAVPASVLEVGCGQGELTTALGSAGHHVLGIDPVAPHGELFRRVRLEDLDPAEEQSFDAVVASHSLHHIRDLRHALDRIAALLRPAGVLVLDEHGWDLADRSTLDWFWNQRQALAAAGHGEAPESIDAQLEEWEAEHRGLHGFETLRAEVARRFDERAFARTAFLHRVLGGVATEVLEQALIDSGAIQALGFRFAGVVRN